VGASVSKFKGSTSHDFMIWLAEWKKYYFVYQGVHHIILDGVDSQGQQYNASLDFKIFEPEFSLNSTITRSSNLKRKKKI